MYAYKHEGFWQCMDTRITILETLWNEVMRLGKNKMKLKKLFSIICANKNKILIFDEEGLKI